MREASNPLAPVTPKMPHQHPTGLPSGRTLRLFCSFSNVLAAIICLVRGIVGDELAQVSIVPQQSKSILFAVVEVVAFFILDAFPAEQNSITHSTALNVNLNFSCQSATIALLAKRALILV